MNKKTERTINFSTITACGEQCTECKKFIDGMCKGCIETDGYVPEWAESGRCKVHVCTRKHGVKFCGLCSEFPCKELTKIIHWNPNIIEDLKLLVKQYPKILGKKVTVTVDRAMGTIHQKHPDICYSINYGYIKGVMAPDGEEQDAYILGVDKPIKEFAGIVIAIIHRNNDVEEKWVVAPEGMKISREEIGEKTYFQEQYFDTYIIM